MNRILGSFNKLIHLFNLSFGVGLILVLALSIARLYFVGINDLGFSPLSHEWQNRIPSQASTPTASPADKPDPETNIYGQVGLSSEQMVDVAKHIYHVANAMDDKYAVADGLTLTMYVLRNMAEIGEYEIGQQDILILIDAFEKLGKMKMDPQVIDIIKQIKKIRFGRKSGDLFAQIFSIYPERGVEIPVNQTSDDPNSSLKEIIKVVIEDGASVSFQDITKTEQIRNAVDFIKTPVKILGTFESLVSELNQFQKGVSDQIDQYFMRDDLLAPPLWVNMDHIYVAVDTTTVFKEINFNFNHALVLPGMSNKEGRLSSFFLGAKAKLLNLKVSVDQ